MKPGNWADDSALAIQPIHADDDAAAAGRISFLATAGAAETIARCPRIAALLPLLADALDAQRADAPGRLFDLAGLDDIELTLIGEVIGDGEVAATVALADGVIAQIQESVMAGLWRVRFTDDKGALAADYLEVAAIPEAIRRAALMTAPRIDSSEPPAEAMNVMPVLAEVREAMARVAPGREPHIISFTLMPMAPADMAFLQQTLGTGPVQIVSRGYGTCRICATGARHVWSVQYTNAMDTVILDTIEIGDVPAVACAADDDFRESASRLRQIEEAYFT